MAKKVGGRNSKSWPLRPDSAGVLRPTASAQDSAAPQNHDLESLYRLQAEICRAMGHPRRIQILNLLSAGERSGVDLRRVLGIGKVNLSQHLSIMKRAGLIRSRQHGREYVYSLAVREISTACQLIRTVLAERLRQGASLARTLRESGHPSDEEEA